MDYLIIITDIFMTILTILAAGFTARFFIGWGSEIVRSKVEKEKALQETSKNQS